MRDFRMLMRGFRMTAGLGRFLTSLRVIAFTVMLGRCSVALRGVFVVFRRLSMGFLGHTDLLGKCTFFVQVHIL